VTIRGIERLAEFCVRRTFDMVESGEAKRRMLVIEAKMPSISERGASLAPLKIKYAHSEIVHNAPPKNVD
jgi:hypothetical protein